MIDKLLNLALVFIFIPSTEKYMVIKIDGECRFCVTNVNDRNFCTDRKLRFLPLEPCKNRFRAIIVGHVSDVKMARTTSTKCANLRSKNQEFCVLVTMYFFIEGNNFCRNIACTFVYGLANAFTTIAIFVIQSSKIKTKILKVLVTTRSYSYPSRDTDFYRSKTVVRHDGF